jgi:hypothetical protein
VDYSLFNKVVVLVMSKRLEKWPGATPIVFPPPIFARTAFVSWFHVSPPPPQKNALWGLYIGVFRTS